MSSKVDVNEVDDAALIRIASRFIPLRSLKQDYLAHLLETAEIIDVPKEREIFDRGDDASRRIYLLNGSVRLEFASGYQEVVRSTNQFFPLVDEIPKPCRAIAHTDSQILSLDIDLLDTVLSWSQITEFMAGEEEVRWASDEELHWLKTILNSNLFFKVPPMNARSIIDKMTPVKVSAGEVIIREGEGAHCCFFIKQGVARVWRRRKSDGSPEHVADIGVGRCFGEDALVYDTVRNASVEMVTAGLIMRLDRVDFNLLLQEPTVHEVDEQDLIRVGQTPVFIDVRTPEEYRTGHLMLSTNMPLASMNTKRNLLEPEVPYVMYCDTGRRSRAAAFLLSGLGYRVMALKGGLAGSGMQHQLVTDMSYVLRGGQPARI